MDRPVRKITIEYADGNIVTLPIDGFHRTWSTSNGDQPPPDKVVYDVHEIRWRDPDRPHIPPKEDNADQT